MSQAITDDELKQWWVDRFAEVVQQGERALPLEMAAVVHYAASGAETTLAVFHSKQPTSHWNADHVSTELLNIAGRHARGLSGGVQQYAMVATFGSKPLRMQPFQRISPMQLGQLPGGGLASEGTSPTGQMAQAQRLLETQAQGNFALTAQLVQGYQALVATLVQREAATAATASANEQKAAERFLALQNLILEWTKQAASQQLRQLGIEIARKMLPLAGPAVGLMTGKDLSPAASEAAFFDWLASQDLSMEQLEAARAALPAGDGSSAMGGAVFIDLLAKARKRKAEREAAEERAVSGIPHASLARGERDALGDAFAAMGEKPSEAAKKVLAASSEPAPTTQPAEETPHGDLAAEKAAALDAILSQTTAEQIRMLGPMLGEELTKKILKIKEPMTTDLLRENERLTTELARLHRQGAALGRLLTAMCTSADATDEHRALLDEILRHCTPGELEERGRMVIESGITLDWVRAAFREAAAAMGN